MKKTLLFVFGGFVVILGLFALLSYTITQKLHNNHLLLLRIDKTAEQFQKHKEEFLEFSKQSDLFDSVASNPDAKLHDSKKFYTLLEESCNRDFHQSSTLLRKIRSVSRAERKLLQTVGQLGFKECGALGRLRKSIHIVEKTHPALETEILALRRHEKDYFMRLDNSYARQHAKIFNYLIIQNPKISELEYYNDNFLQAQTLLGLLYGNDNAQFNSWLSVAEILQKEIRAHRTGLMHENSKISDNSLVLQLIISAIIIVVLIFISVWFIRRFSKQVNTLQKAMNSFVESNYKNRLVESTSIPKNEIGLLTKRFYQLARKIEMEVTYLEDRVQNRTVSLRRKNDLLEQQHSEIVESLHYAQNLQKSLLVPQRKISQQFSESFVYYSPKNLVGGDFYWMKEFKRGNSEFVLFALADCTGHGVPGALISVLGMNTLDELYSNGLNNPANLLNQLRFVISRRFNTETEQRLDGMDISIFLLNKRTGKLTFAGAQMPLWIVKSNTVIELKGQRSPIGLTYGKVEPFYNQVIQLEAHDRILLFTDGLTDQFGAKNQKKWGKKGLRTCLHLNGKLNTQQLFHAVMDNYENWKRDNEQTDDCSLLMLEFQFSSVAMETEHFLNHEIQNEKLGMII